MQSFPRFLVVSLLLGFTAGALIAFSAQAAPKSKQIETEAVFLEYDAETKTITVKVMKPGKSVKGLPKLKRGKEARFNVIPTGSVLTRTTVKTRQGTAGRFEDLRADRKVKIYWIPDPDAEGERKARSISVFVPAEDQGEEAD